MTDNIIVRSNDPIVEENTPVGSEPKQAAPAPKEPEQKIESADSETVETEQDDDAELSADSNEESEDSEKSKGKKKGGFKRRIDKLNARVAEREKELEYWRQQALKASEGKPTEQPKEARQTTSGKPDPEAYDSHAEYVEALTDWKVSQFYAEKAAADQKAQMQTEQQKALKAHVDRFQAYAEKNPDIHELIEDVQDIAMPSAVQEIIVSSENGPELMHELAKNRARYAEICKMSPLAAARAIGAIEAKLSSGSSEQATSSKKVTGAPRPLTSVSTGKSVVPKSLDDPNLSQREYERLRAEQIRNRA